MWRGILRHLPSFGAEPLRIVAAAAKAVASQAHATCGDHDPAVIGVCWISVFWGHISAKFLKNPDVCLMIS